MSQKDVIQYYECIAGEYDESRFENSYGQFLDAQERSVLDKLIDMREKGRRLDLACGTGSGRRPGTTVSRKGACL